MSDKEFKQKMAAIYLEKAESLMDDADDLAKDVKHIVEVMLDYYKRAHLLIKVAGNLQDETH